MRIAGWISMVVMLAAVPAWPQSGVDSGPVLRVQGTGEVRETPDLATVRMGIVEQSPTAEEAQQSVNEVAGRIFDALDAIGVEESQIQTARLTLSPVYAPGRPEPGETPRIAAYRASNTVSVRIEDLERIGPVIDAALDSGANQLEGVFFELADDRAAQQDALRAAVRDARGKAEAMADALDIDLDGIQSVTEGVVFSQPQFETARAVVMQDAAPTPVSPGQISVSASVTIEYRISGDR